MIRAWWGCGVGGVQRGAGQGGECREGKKGGIKRVQSIRLPTGTLHPNNDDVHDNNDDFTLEVTTV